jgi:hypothetical protein
MIPEDQDVNPDNPDQEEYYKDLGEYDETNYDPYSGCDTFEREGWDD